MAPLSAHRIFRDVRAFSAVIIDVLFLSSQKDAMSERVRSSFCNAHTKMPGDIGPRKTMLVLVIVVGCFAVLWPKVFYPMLVGSVNQYTKPNALDKAAGCCDVFSETDINTIKIMSELCSNIVQASGGSKPPTGKELVSRCKTEVLESCGIDISAVLQEQIRLGRSIKQIINEVRSLNGSTCLKYHFGIAAWQLGVPHRITVNFSTNVRQERPPYIREATHPAFRERGSAIPRPPNSPPRNGARIIEGKPGPVPPGMRPPMGAGGHVPISQKSTSSMSVIMPVYTVGIVIFFTYTLMKLVFKKQPDGVGGSLYPTVGSDPRFRKEVFESEMCRNAPRISKSVADKLVVNAMSALLDEVDEEYEARKKASEAANEGHNLTNGDAVKLKEKQEEQASVKILGMEMTASCEGGQKWNRPNDLFSVSAPAQVPHEPAQEIYLEGTLPPQSQLLVADSATEAQPVKFNANSDPAVVLAGKMTLSVISSESPQENEKDEKLIEINGDIELVDDDAIEESKYTTASNATAAENEISDEENTGDDDDGEEIEIEEEEIVNNIEPDTHVNHLPEIEE